MTLSLKTIGFSILLFLGLIIALSPVDHFNKKEISQAELIKQLNSESVYVQPDELAHWIINDDPGYQLIDLRSDEDYTKYNIPGNLHLNFEKLTDSQTFEIIDPYKMIVLTSNGNTRAAQAWIFLRQLGYNDVYILAGGVNHWVNIFSNPNLPNDGLTDDEHFNFEFRNAAGPAMMGSAIPAAGDKSNEDVIKPKPVRHKKKSGPKNDGGC